MYFCRQRSKCKKWKLHFKVFESKKVLLQCESMWDDAEHQRALLTLQRRGDGQYVEWLRAHRHQVCLHTSAPSPTIWWKGQVDPIAVFLRAGNTGYWMLSSNTKTMLFLWLLFNLESWFIRGSENLEEGGGGRGHKHFACFLSTWKSSHWKGTLTLR